MAIPGLLVLVAMVVMAAAVWTGLLWPRLTVEETTGQEWFANAETRRAEINLTLRNRGLPAVDVASVVAGGDGLQVESVAVPERPIQRGRTHAMFVRYAVEDCAAAGEQQPVTVGVQRWWGLQWHTPDLSDDARGAWRDMVDFACGRF